MEGIIKIVLFNKGKGNEWQKEGSSPSFAFRLEELKEGLILIVDMAIDRLPEVKETPLGVYLEEIFECCSFGGLEIKEDLEGIGIPFTRI